MELNDLREDLAAFADEEEDVAVDPDGNFMLVRGGREIVARLVDVDGNSMVDYEGGTIPYRKFLTHELGRLDQLAERLTRREAVSAFVDSRVSIFRPAEDLRSGKALEILEEECRQVPPFSARVTFLTADAGHGKTAVLREHQARQARRFLDGTGSYVFWHVDLQGRQLLRLSEALMGDLGDLRISGLWMPAVLRLMRQKALVLAIDGFDELAAEQGGTDALGSLATLVSQLKGQGVVIAAARRSFFDTDDYLRRAGVIERAMTSPCQFDQMSLLPWDRAEGVAYLQRVSMGDNKIRDPEFTYAEISAELGDDDGHPMVTRPFLLTQVARALLIYDLDPAEFIRASDDPLSGVAAVVHAFVTREVQEKWVSSETGEPYLSIEQHMQILADVAEEMYRSQRDRLEIDVIETIATLLLDQWGIDPSRRHQILEMVRMHVLLVPTGGGGDRMRSFDHPEFRDYFIAYALKSHLEVVMDGGNGSDLSRYLSVAQISDSTARYVCGMLERTEDRVTTLLATLERVVAREWKPTFLQVNVGTLIPFVCDGLFAGSTAEFSGRVIYSSLAFERSRLHNLTLEGGSFVNASLGHSDWTNVRLRKCALGEIMLSADSHFDGVVFEDCSIDGLRISLDDEEDIREYAPDRIAWRLEAAGITRAEIDDEVMLPVQLIESPMEKLAHRVVRLFSRTTVVSENQLVHRFKADHQAVIDTLVPLLEAHEILQPRTWKGAGQSRVWALTERFDDLLQAQSGVGRANLVEFWRAVRAIS
ncbi:hypothetical protein [Mumia sp. Pv 4-285]|uniref:hypothetical protein n=1 Tax=Mumia qirimensis TaxID=3234852 RepID=UPI00351D0583